MVTGEGTSNPLLDLQLNASRDRYMSIQGTLKFELIVNKKYNRASCGYIKDWKSNQLRVPTIDDKE